MLERACGPAVTLVDSAESTSREVERELGKDSGVGADGARSPGVRLFATDAGPRFAKLAERILGEPVALELIDVNGSYGQPQEVEGQ